MSFNITPVASGYQEIHPYSAMNIDSVKINTSLIMMKECSVYLIHQLAQQAPVQFETETAHPRSVREGWPD